MGPQGGRGVEREQVLAPPARNASGDYRRLLAALASRARWLGSRDPEGAAQEALKRSLENSGAQPSVRYYFGEQPSGMEAPRWLLDQLFAWLHGVLYNVVREEQNRAGSRREILSGGIGADLPAGKLNPADPAPGQLDVLIEKEIHGIVVDCFLKLDREYQSVLRMRADGLKYGDIANRLGVNENTVATWVSRGLRELGQLVRQRTGQPTGLARGGGQ